MIKENIKKRSPQIASCLTERLLLIAEASKGAKKLCDIGTDHAYIPVYMVACMGTEEAIAADINKGPLERAQKSIEKFGLTDKISTRLSNGLLEFSPDEADTVVIAGMGGTLIAEILEASPQMKKEGIRFVLQPMTAEEELRKYLDRHGYRTVDEFMTCEGEKLYTVIVAEVGKSEARSEEFYHVSKKLFEKKDKLFKLFLDRKISEFEKVVNGLSKAEKSEENVKKSQYYGEICGKLKNLKEECEKW